MTAKFSIWSVSEELPYTLFTPSNLSEFQNNNGIAVDGQLKINDGTYATVLNSKKLYNEITQLRLKIEYAETETWVAFKFRSSNPVSSDCIKSDETLCETKF